MKTINTVNQLAEAEEAEEIIQRFYTSKWQDYDFEDHDWGTIKLMISKGEVRVKPEPVVFHEKRSARGDTIWGEAGSVIISGVEYSATGRTTEPTQIIQSTT